MGQEQPRSSDLSQGMQTWQEDLNYRAQDKRQQGD